MLSRPFVRKCLLAAILALVGGCVAVDWYLGLPPAALERATYVGHTTCAACHQAELAQWRGSHHDRAMELATPASVLGNFDDVEFTRLGQVTRFFRRDGKYFVNTEGPDGELHDYEVKYTFGVDPLQQYMVELTQGRVQVLRVSWDTSRGEWFYLPPPDATDERLAPDDPLHWTGIAQNWNTTCAECHSTNLRKNYDPATDSYDTTYSEIDVSCEACHGPGSVHVELAEAHSLFWDRTHGYGLARLKSKDSDIEIGACATCHSRRHLFHPDFRPGRPFLDYHEPSPLMAGLYHDDGQILDEVYVYGSFLQSKMYSKDVRCTDCHNPHSLELKFPGNRLCAQCHQPGKYDTPGHHHHPPDSTGSQCVACHMPVRTYMVVDPRRDHSFRMPRPDLSVTLGTPNACNDCHTEPNETAQWAADAVRQWYGPDRRDDPHWAPALAAGNAGQVGGEALLVELLGRRQTPAIVRATAVTLLQQYDGPASRQARARALADADPWVRLAAVRAAPGLTAEERVAQWAPRLTDPVRSVRAAAASQLAGVPPEILTSAQDRAISKGLDEFRRMQRNSLDRAAGYLNLGGLAARQGNWQQAAHDFRLAILREPYLSGPRSELVMALERLGGDPDEVRRLREEELELLLRDVELLPDSGVTVYRLGLLQFLLGDLATAQGNLAKAAELAPEVGDYWLAVALLAERRYEAEGEVAHFETAVAALKKLEALDRGDPRPKQVLQRMLGTKQRLDAGP